jgi:hypothetical protein
MHRARDSRWGRRIAAWPSAAVVGASVGGIVIASRFLPVSAALPVAAVTVAPVIAYCLLRTTRRWDAFGVWLAPSAVSTVVSDITGLPQWTVAVPVLVIGLAALAHDDVEERRERAQPA